MNTIEAILELSGPFMSDKAREAHRHYLQGLTPEKQQERLDDLRQSERCIELKHAPV